MWIGNPSWRSFVTYIEGFVNGLCAAGAADQHWTQEFGLWFASRYGYPRNYRWDGNLLRHCDGDEARAMEALVPLFDQFLVEREVGLQYIEQWWIHTLSSRPSIVVMVFRFACREDSDADLLRRLVEFGVYRDIYGEYDDSRRSADEILHGPYRASALVPEAFRPLDLAEAEELVRANSPAAESLNEVERQQIEELIAARVRRSSSRFVLGKLSPAKRRFSRFSEMVLLDRPGLELAVVVWAVKR
jgi:hypothetical protein